MSLLRSRARSGERKQERDERVSPASYKDTELKSFRIMLVASISTSVSWWKLWLAARYPILFSVNLVLDITYNTNNPNPHYIVNYYNSI